MRVIQKDLNKTTYPSCHLHNPEEEAPYSERTEIKYAAPGIQVSGTTLRVNYNSANKFQT
jgi:hypothetical protein